MEFRVANVRLTIVILLELLAQAFELAAADIFEIGNTGESFADTWPLKELIAKQITPQLLAWS